MILQRYTGDNVDQFAFTIIVPKVVISRQIEGVFEQSITRRITQGFLKRILKKSPGLVLPVEHANACTVH
jgi:DICT domain-containing protein